MLLSHSWRPAFARISLHCDALKTASQAAASYQDAGVTQQHGRQAVEVAPDGDKVGGRAGAGEGVEVAQQDKQRRHILQAFKTCKTLKRSELGGPNQPRSHCLQPG